MTTDGRIDGTLFSYCSACETGRTVPDTPTNAIAIAMWVAGHRHPDRVRQPWTSTLVRH